MKQINTDINMPEYLTFETERLFLRPTAEEDAAFILELMNTPKWLENIGDRNVRSIEDAKAYIQNRITPQLERLGFSNYTVIRKSDGAKLGSCGLYDREGLEGVDIGFAFLPQYEGQGYALESAQKVKDTGINHFGIRQISAITIPENMASRRLIEKLGLQFVEKIKLPDDDAELLLYRVEVG
ncbi:MAG: GNAT family N-acetyltransferase [Saprospiraceae bacterium]|nr:GNAT family N-acetyltransferase [Saprospiraceae bacterium]